MTRALLTICCLSSLIACVSGPVPKWEGKIWLGRTKYLGIIFTDADGKNEIIRADDPRFNDYVAMTTEDFKSLIVTYVQGCRQWRQGVPMMTAKDANARFMILMQNIQTEAAQEEPKQ